MGIAKLEARRRYSGGDPGRLLDLLEQRSMSLNRLDSRARRSRPDAGWGFMPDIRRVVEQLPTSANTAFFRHDTAGDRNAWPRGCCAIRR